MKKLSILHRLILLNTVLLFSIGCLVGIVTLTQGYWSFNPHVEISEFTICQGLDQKINLPVNPGFEFYQDIDRLFVCGKLQSNIRTDLLFLWYSEDEEVIYHNTDNIRYVSGYFASELPMNEPLEPGKYRVDVYYGRIILASAQFEILSR